jgi:uncharacterized protein YcbX
VKTIARLSVTPVKALRLSHPERVDLTAAGIPTDRRFFLVDEDAALFDASDHGPLLQVVPDYDVAGERLTLRFPSGEHVDGPTDELGDPIRTDFFGRAVDGHLVDGPFDDALSAFVGRPVRMARVDRDGDGQDVHPLTLVSSASVRDLAGRGHVDGELDARRFRMNLEVGGCEPYEEDGWDGGEVRVGGATIRLHGQVPRCVITTLGPDTGTKDFGTLTEIARYRPRIGGRGGLPFGMYAEIVRPGSVALGDAVEPISPAGRSTASAR